MILVQNLKCKIPHSREQLPAKAAIALGISQREIKAWQILRRSLDARKKPELFYLYTLEVEVDQEEKVLRKALKNKRLKEQLSISDRKPYLFPDRKKNASNLADEKADSNLCRPIVVGAGPAGLFCTYYLALAGLRPILLERGKSVEDRARDVEEFWRTGKLNPSSNVQFGEGGAGTFSDGKLNTLVKDKDGRNRAVLETFVRFGAKESILYDAKPHIGTDQLSKVIAAMREELLQLGADIRFNAMVSDLVIDEKSEERRIGGVILKDGEFLPSRNVVLAIGHSARDTFFMLKEKKLEMEAKPFAVGFRVEHPQNMINKSQYGIADPGELGAAVYKVTAKTSTGRGVYSFCMCPGGYVVNASSEEGRLAVNGMSYSGRSGKNSNSAIIVAVTPDDYPSKDPLGGIIFQRELEEKAYALGEGRIPVQRYGDFRKRVKKEVQDEAEGRERRVQENVISGVRNDIEQELQPSCKGEYIWTDLSGLLPQSCNQAFVEGMTQFGRQIPGFDREDAILSGVESRTSSPVRIHRDETLQSDIRGLYPCGEGAGYAGGITSAAMDGLRVAEEIAKHASVF